jgi:hypothetical protein
MGNLSALDGAAPSVLGERDGIPLQSHRSRAGLLSFTWKRFKLFLPLTILPTVLATPGGVMLKTMAPASRVELSFYLCVLCCIMCSISCVCVVKHSVSAGFGLVNLRQEYGLLFFF